MEQPLLQQLKLDTKKRRQALEKRAEALLNAELELAQIKSEKELYIMIRIDSAWANEGENAIEVTTQGSLEKAFESAVAMFKKSNKRSDVQGTYHAFVVLPHCQEDPIPIPERYWQEFTRLGN